jgi:hypothetical protein
MKNADAPAVKREEEEEWGQKEMAMTGQEPDHDLRAKG